MFRQIWSSASPSNFACLKLKQKAAVRIVLGTEHLNILPLHLMQHFIQDFLPDSFNNMWSLNAYRRNAESHIALRNDDVFDVPFARTSLTERQPSYSYPKQPSGYVAVLLATGSVFFICSVELYLQSCYTNCIAAYCRKYILCLLCLYSPNINGER